jgi:ankyrin repeat protein
MKASKQGQKEIVELLLKNKADINIKNINGETALIWGSIDYF